MTSGSLKIKAAFKVFKITPEKSIQEFHTKFVFIPADKAANNIIIVWRLDYVNNVMS